MKFSVMENPKRLPSLKLAAFCTPENVDGWKIDPGWNSLGSELLSYVIYIYDIYIYLYISMLYYIYR